MSSQPASRPGAKVVVATTVALAFISFWRAASIVLSDLASSAFLRRRHRRTGGRTQRGLVCSGRHAVQFRRAFRVSRKLLDVRARRRLRRGARLHGPLRRARFRLVAAVRLHPHRPYQRGQRRPVSRRADERNRGMLHSKYAAFAQLVFGRLRRSGHHLLLVGKHQGHARIERQSAAHHADHHRDGGDLPDLVPAHSDPARPRADPAAAARLATSTSAPPRSAGSRARSGRRSPSSPS